MKTAGEIIASLFDEKFTRKAEEHSKLHKSWEDVTAQNGLSAAAAHSRIRNIDKGILLIETDHPGWKQILQTKQTGLLDGIRFRFPDLDITGISFMLGNGSLQPAEDELPDINAEKEETENKKTFTHTVIKDHVAYINENIKDEALKEKLISLGKTIPIDESAKKLDT